MKGRTVVVSPEARDDLVALYDWIAAAAHPVTALRCIERIEAFLQGLRILGFERRVTLAFAVEAERVVILRVFSAGRNWEEAME